MSIECKEYGKCVRNTLQGFAKIYVPSWGLIIDGVSIHKKEGRSWASLPSRPQIGSDKKQIVGADGKAAYSPFLTFVSRETADAFSAAVVEAVVRFFGKPPASETRVPVGEAIDDAILF